MKKIKKYMISCVLPISIAVQALAVPGMVLAGQESVDESSTVLENNMPEVSEDNSPTSETEGSGSDEVDKNDDLKDYVKFKNILEDFKIYYGLKQYSLKELDRYLWLLGKEYFKKNICDAHVTIKTIIE